LVGDRAETLTLRLAPGMAGGFGVDLGLAGLLGQTVDAQITTPALLIDGIELVVERGENERLPILEHPLRRKG
jgi:TldD protein